MSVYQVEAEKDFYLACRDCWCQTKHKASVLRKISDCEHNYKLVTECLECGEVSEKDIDNGL